MLCLSGKQSSVQNDRSCDPTGVVKVCLSLTSVALSTAESEYISITKSAAHALEVRSAMVGNGMTFNVVCETDASAGRAMATRRGGRPRASLGRAIVVAAAVVRRRRRQTWEQRWSI